MINDLVRQVSELQAQVSQLQFQEAQLQGGGDVEAAVRALVKPGSLNPTAEELDQ